MGRRRRLPFRRVRYVAAAALVIGAALAVGRPASGATPKVISVIYSGTLEVRAKTPPFAGNLASETYRYELTWRIHATAPPGTSGTWTLDVLKGSVKDVATDGTGNTSRSCSATIGPDRSESVGGTIFAQGQGFGVIVPSGGIPWGLAAATCDNDASVVVPRFTPEAFESDPKVLAAWAAVTKPKVTFPAKGSYTQPLDFSWHCPDKGCGGTEVSIDAAGKTTHAGTIDVKLTSRIDFATPGFVAGSPKLSPGTGSKPPTAAPSNDPKALARADLRRAVMLAVGPCLGLTLVGGFQTIVTIASPPTAAVDLLVADAMRDITTDALSEPLLTMCTEELRQIVVDYSVIKRDPAVPRASPPLHLPSCTRWQGKPRTYCRKLEPEATKLVAAELAVLPALKRLQSAGMALRNARAKHDAQATASARAKVKAAAGAVTAARTAVRAAGKSVAATVRAAGLQAKLTRKQAAAATAAMLNRLAKQGVPTADLRKLAGSALKSAPLDLLAALRS